MRLSLLLVEEKFVSKLHQTGRIIEIINNTRGGIEGEIGERANGGGKFR